MKDHRYSEESWSVYLVRAKCECGWRGVVTRGSGEDAHDRHLASLNEDQQALDFGSTAA